MITRRPLLLGALGLVSGFSSGCSARSLAAQGGDQAGATEAGSLGPVGPGASWRGAAYSGFGGDKNAPADVLRTTAKPAIRWWTPAEQRFGTNLAVGVDADALGGIDYVEFLVEGSVRRVSTRSLNADPDANGKARSRGGYWITLNHSAFLAASAANNTICIYARAVAKDSRMQSRLIGPLILYPEASANDFIKTIAPFGADFVSLRAAIDAAKAASAKSPLLTIIQSGNYELDNATSATAGVGKGYCVVTAAPGVKAVLGRAKAFDPNAPASWNWTPGWDGMEFRGSGIVFDLRNWSSMIFPGKAAWFNGCRFTNSVGTRDTLYWNKGNRPSPGSNVASYWTDVYCEFGPSPFNQQLMATGCRLHKVFGDHYSGTPFISECYDYSSTSEFFRELKPALQVQYSGSGVGTIQKTGNNGGAGSIILVDDAGTMTIPLGGQPSDPYYEITAVAAAISGRPNWSATALDTSRRSNWLTGPRGIGNVHGFTAQDARAAAFTLHTLVDIHGDWWQGYGPPRENIIIRNNVLRGPDNNLSSTMFNDGSSQKDMIVRGNIWIGFASLSPFFGGANHHHYVFTNNVAESGLIIIGAAGDKTYSLIAQNVHGQFGSAPAKSFPAEGPQYRDNAFVVSFNGVPTGPNYTGNVQIPSVSSVFVDMAAGDFRPAGLLLKNLRPRLEEYDSRLNPRGGNDAIGPWAVGFSPPRWPEGIAD